MRQQRKIRCGPDFRILLLGVIGGVLAGAHPRLPPGLKLRPLKPEQPWRLAASALNLGTELLRFVETLLLARRATGSTPAPWLRDPAPDPARCTSTAERPAVHVGCGRRYHAAITSTACGQPGAPSGVDRFQSGRMDRPHWKLRWASQARPPPAAHHRAAEAVRAPASGWLR